MISWLTFRAMQTTRVEQQSWHVVSDGHKGWLVHDYSRQFPIAPPFRSSSPSFSFRKYYFPTLTEAEDFKTYQIHRALVLAILMPWRKI